MNIMVNHINSFKLIIYINDMEYQAKFGIDGAVSHGFGLKEQDYWEETEKIVADSDYEAITLAFNKAKHLSEDGLSNPKTGYTTVRISELKVEDKVIDQKSINDNPAINFENRQAVFKDSHFAKLLRI